MTALPAIPADAAPVAIELPRPFTFIQGGHRYTVTAFAPHERANGRPTWVALATGRCALCGEPYALTLGLRGAAYLVRTCPAHRGQMPRGGSKVGRSRSPGPPFKKQRETAAGRSGTKIGSARKARNMRARGRGELVPPSDGWSGA